MKYLVRVLREGTRTLGPDPRGPEDRGSRAIVQEWHKVHLEARLLEAHRTGSLFSACKQNVRRAFPSVRMPIALRILEKYGMPWHLSSYVSAFYDQLKHWFESAGAAAAAPTQPEVGVLQSCPASCLLMAAIMAVWVHAMREVPGVATKVYVDDRIVTATSDEPEERPGRSGARLGNTSRQATVRV